MSMSCAKSQPEIVQDAHRRIRLRGRASKRAKLYVTPPEVAPCRNLRPDFTHCRRRKATVVFRLVVILQSRASGHDVD